MSWRLMTSAAPCFGKGPNLAPYAGLEQQFADHNLGLEGAFLFGARAAANAPLAIRHRAEDMVNAARPCEYCGGPFVPSVRSCPGCGAPMAGR